MIFVLLAAAPRSLPTQEISNKGKCFGVVLAMFKSADSTRIVRPQEQPDEAPDERPAPGAAAYQERAANTESEQYWELIFQLCDPSWMYVVLLLLSMKTWPNLLLSATHNSATVGGKSLHSQTAKKQGPNVAKGNDR